MKYINCPYLGGEVELSEERECHIQQQHPDLLPLYSEQLVTTIKEPDEVRLSSRFGNARLFSKWYENIKKGKHIVVVVVSEEKKSNRHWVITAYIARKLAGGETEWIKS